MLDFAVVVLATLLGADQSTQSTDVLPEAAVNELQYFVGQWRAEGRIASGAPVRGNLSLQWSPDRHCLVGNYRGQLGPDPIRGNVIWGWDSATSELLWVAFYSNGALEMNRQKIEAPGKLRGSFSGSVKEGKYSAQGESDRQGPDEWTFVTKGFEIGEEKPGEFSVRFVRVAAEPKKTK